MVCSVNVLDYGDFFQLNKVMLCGVADGNARLAGEFWILRFPNRACDRIEGILQAEEQIFQTRGPVETAQ